MFKQFSLASLFLFQLLARSTRSDEFDSLSSLHFFSDENSQDEDPIVNFPHFSSSDSSDQENSFYSSKSEASSSRIPPDTIPFRSGRMIPYPNSFTNEEELFSEIRDYLLSTRKLGHEVKDISQWKKFLSTNSELQRDLDFVIRNLQISSTLSFHSITLQNKVLRKYKEQLKADRSRIKFTQSLINLVNNSELNKTFQLDQVVTLSQWEGDRQSRSEHSQDESILPLNSSEISSPPISRKGDVAFRHTQEDHETCLSSLKGMYSFDLVNMDRCIGCELHL